jgi:hypothetical protein
MSTQGVGCTLRGVPAATYVWQDALRSGLKRRSAAPPDNRTLDVTSIEASLDTPSSAALRARHADAVHTIPDGWYPVASARFL